jgi:hypothetical protein
MKSMPNRSKIIVIAIVLTIHLGVDFLLVLKGSTNIFFSARPWEFLIDTVCMSQICVLTVVLIFSKIRLYWAYLILVASMIFLWFIEKSILHLDPTFFDLEAIRYPSVFLQHSLAIVLVAAFYKTVCWVIRITHDESAAQSNECFQFGIDSLLMWMFAAAVTLGLLKWANKEYYWSLTLLAEYLSRQDSVENWLLKFHVAVTLLFFWAVNSPGPCFQRIVGVTIVVEAVILLYSQTIGDGEILPWFAQGNLFSISVLATLLPFRRCDILNKKHQPALDGS